MPVAFTNSTSITFINASVAQTAQLTHVIFMFISHILMRADKLFVKFVYTVILDNSSFLKDTTGRI